MGLTFNLGRLSPSIFTDASNNVGIGGSPSGSYKLEVTGTINATKTLTLRGQTDPTSGVGMELFYRSADTSSYLQSYDRTSSAWKDVRIYGNALYFGSQGSNHLTINTSGNVGIGITTGTGKVFAKQTTANFYDGINCYASNSDSFVGIGHAGALAVINSSYNTTGAYYPLAFYTSDTERMRIRSDGNVGIGSDGSANYRLISKGADDGSSNYAILLQNNTGTVLLRVRNDGAFFTGTAAGSPYNNTYGNAANVYIGSDGVMGRSTSSLKYKDNVQDYTKGLAEVMQLRAVSYTSKNPSEEGQTFAGLIAEEVHDLGLTEFVTYAEDGTPDALAYQNMIALLTKAIQELSDQNQDLKSRLDKAGL